MKITAQRLQRLGASSESIREFCEVFPDGSANKEFIRTLGGGYIIWNNAENTVQGSAANTFGYEGYGLHLRLASRTLSYVDFEHPSHEFGPAPALFGAGVFAGLGLL